MFKSYVFLKNITICSDGSVLIFTYSFNYLKKFEKVKISEKDFKSFQNKFQNQSSFFTNKLLDNKNYYYRQKYFKI
jgi:hypothetical protein